jgi:transposase
VRGTQRPRNMGGQTLTSSVSRVGGLSGLTKLIVPDNTRTGVACACRCDPDLNPTYHQMAMHYGVVSFPRSRTSQGTKRRWKVASWWWNVGPRLIRSEARMRQDCS